MLQSVLLTPAAIAGDRPLMLLCCFTSAQGRLVRDLANVARERELKIILTTHSPYIIEELPENARMQIFWSEDDRKVMTGVSAQFAMSKMDDSPHPDCEVYVEDESSKTMLSEILSQRSPDLLA